ncbi:DUF309 domain-containing protein [Sporosarcina sp. NPDC096371]|uniref:DUF309 domain-containing protein n=1 Tax=Sporosarcina sp. NPDC096371 TaxID=3364530 RepID=UPI00380E54B0
MHPYHHPLFVQFIVYFNDNQDYFECHEVLEEYWKSLPDGDKEHPLTAYILLSTGMYHWRRGNLTGAIRTLRKAEKKFPTFATHFAEELDIQQLVSNVSHAVNLVEKESPFESFSLLVTSVNLQAHITLATQSMQLLAAGSDAVIHKHLLRDRTGVLQEREEKKKGRRH